MTSGGEEVCGFMRLDMPVWVVGLVGGRVLRGLMSLDTRVSGVGIPLVQQDLSFTLKMAQNEPKIPQNSLKCLKMCLKCA